MAILGMSIVGQGMAFPIARADEVSASSEAPASSGAGGEEACTPKIDADTETMLVRSSGATVAALSAGYKKYIYKASNQYFAELPEDYLVAPENFSPDLSGLWSMIVHAYPRSYWDSFGTPEGVISLMPEDSVFRTSSVIHKYAASSWDNFIGTYVYVQALTPAGKQAMATDEERSYAFVNFLNRALLSVPLDSLWRSTASMVLPAINACRTTPLTQADLLKNTDSGVIRYPTKGAQEGIPVGSSDGGSSFGSSLGGSSNGESFGETVRRYTRLSLIPGDYIVLVWKSISSLMGVDA